MFSAVAVCRSPKTKALAAVVLMAGIAVPAGVCAGQADDELSPGDVPPLPPEPDTSVKFSIAAGYQFVLNTGVGSTGDVSISRTGIEVGAEIPIDAAWKVIANLRYEFDHYSFSPVTSLGASPWGDTSLLTLDARVQWNATQQWIFFAGGVVQSSRETSASWSGSWTGGGTFGATYLFNRQLAVGLGFGVISQLGDPVLAYPLIILNWQINEDMRLTSVAGPAGIAATGLEFIYTIGAGWEVGVGGRYEFRRFLLDGTGVAPGGTGEETTFPFWARLGYRASQNFSVDLFVGMLIGGNFSIDNAAGVQVAESSYSPTPTAALVLHVSF